MTTGKVARIARHFIGQLKHLDAARRDEVIKELLAWARPGPRRTANRLTTWERVRFKHWLSWLYGPECAYCHRGDGGLMGLTIDHIKPISKGGAVRDVRNMALACLGCNRAKGDAWTE